MSVSVRIGEARVELDGEQHSVDSETTHLRTSATYNFDDVLHAVQRVAGAVLSAEDAELVNQTMSGLRRRLGER